LRHGSFGDLSFLNPQNEHLGRGTFERSGVKIDVARPCPVLLEDAIDTFNRIGFCSFLRKPNTMMTTPTVAPMAATRLHENSMNYAIVGGQRAQRKSTALIQRRATLSAMWLAMVWPHF
jgi:hypothetical protein